MLVLCVRVLTPSPTELTCRHFLVKADYPYFWLHVDAAWAGVALACPEHRERAQLEGINMYADSLCINFHKVGTFILRRHNLCAV
jgi:hypothetical protein